MGPTIKPAVVQTKSQLEEEFENKEEGKGGEMSQTREKVARLVVHECSFRG